MCVCACMCVEWRGGEEQGSEEVREERKEREVNRAG